MHQLKHIVENGGANTAERCHEEVLQVMCFETGWSGKNKHERKCKESEKKAEDCTLRCCTRLRTGGTWELSHFASIFPPVVWYPSRLQAFWVRDSLFHFVLCTELLSTLTIIIQQKLMYTWQGWTSDRFETLGKLETASYWNLTMKTIKWGGERDGGIVKVHDMVYNLFDGLVIPEQKERNWATSFTQMITFITSHLINIRRRWIEFSSM